MDVVHYDLQALCVPYLTLCAICLPHIVSFSKATAVRSRLMWLSKSSTPPVQVLADQKE